jgi:hypothetical protein
VHGHVAEAVRWNPLVLLVVPGFAAWVVAAYRDAKWPKMPNFAVAGMLVAAGVFMVVRNL